MEMNATQVMMMDLKLENKIHEIHSEYLFEVMDDRTLYKINQRLGILHLNLIATSMDYYKGNKIESITAKFDFDNNDIIFNIETEKN